MLAVQQSVRMASDKSPSDPYLPFGYTIDPNQEPLDPPEPPPGDPLLTDSDSKFLSSFFEDMTADQYNMPSFGEGLNFSDTWLDLPPQFMGTATSFGPQFGSPLASATGHGMAGEGMDFSRSTSEVQLMPPPPLPHNHHHIQPNQTIQQQPPQPQPQAQAQAQVQQHNTQHHLQQHTQRHAPQHQYHSDDVLNAAATLLQNGSGARSASGNQEYNFPRRPVAPPAAQLRHQPMEDFPTDGRRSVPQPAQESEYGDWMYGAQQGRITTPTVQTDRANDFQWGSDASFSPVQGYTPRLSKGTTLVDSMHREQLKLLESLEVSKSAASTRPSSPSNAHHGQKASGQTQTLPKVKEDPEAPPRKRRKSKIAREGTESVEGDDTPAPAPAAATTKPRRRKPKAERSGHDNSPPPSATSVTAPAALGEGPSSEAGSSGGGSGKRRKPSMNGSKAPRENLSEEQKRENHIRSEQKRRTLIKEGFDDLCELVPGLRGGGFSKSTMLTISAEWLEELLQGNEALASQLATIERG